MVSTFLDNQAHELLRYSSRFGRQFQSDAVGLLKTHDDGQVVTVDDIEGVGIGAGYTSTGTEIDDDSVSSQLQTGASRKIRRIRGNNDAINKNNKESAVAGSDNSGNSSGSSAIRSDVMIVDQAGKSSNSDHIIDNDENQSPYFSFAAFVAQMAKGSRPMNEATAEKEAESMLEQYLQVANNTTTLHDDPIL